MQAMLAAGREVPEWRRILAKSGDNLVDLVLRHEGPFYILDHYPKGDVYDPESHVQWYYHAHDKAERRASTAISTPSRVAAACARACARRRSRTFSPKLPVMTSPGLPPGGGLHGPRRMVDQAVYHQPLGHRRDVVRRPRRRRHVRPLRHEDQQAGLAGEPLALRHAAPISGRRSRT